MREFGSYEMPRVSDVASTGAEPGLEKFEVGGEVFTLASAPSPEELERLVRDVHDAETTVRRFARRSP